MASGIVSVLSDEELALEAKGGALSAFDEIVRRHEGAIYRFILARVNRAADAEDLTQQAFVKAYRKIHLYRCRYRFLPWLYIIARRTTIEFYRKNQGESDANAIEQVDARLPSDAVESRDTHRELWKQIRRILPEASATAFWLRYEENLSIAEVAKVLNRTSVHVKVLLHRARATLADKLNLSDASSPPPLPILLNQGREPNA